MTDMTNTSAHAINARDAALGRTIREQYVNLECFWEKQYREYLATHDFKSAVATLKSGLDAFSIEYVDRFFNLLELCKIKNSLLVKHDYAFTSRDHLYLRDFNQFLGKLRNFPYVEFGNAVKFIFSNQYGLIDVPRERLSSVDGKAIIDGGGYVGDTAILFSNLFRHSPVLAFEPVQKHFNMLSAMVSKYRLTGQITPLMQGLSDTSGTAEISVADEQNFDAGANLAHNDGNVHRTASLIETVSIDDLVAARKLTPGLIKLDVEGWESKVIQGAVNSIKTYKPLLVIAIYHSPIDFFELKPFLESLDLGYRFMIRRSELCLPMTDLVLIAY